MSGRIRIPPDLHSVSREVIYTEKRWSLLKRKRGLAIKLMKILASSLPKEIVLLYGSIARGDVREESDVEVAVVEPITPTSVIEDSLRSAGFHPVMRKVVQATPRSTPKYYIYLNDMLTVVSIPLARLREREREFYNFGGALNIDGLMEDSRVPGVNKELILIMPTHRGHLEYPIVGHESFAASVLGISVDTVLERVKVLTKRRTVGTTGLYLEYTLGLDESLEEALVRISGMRKGFRERLSQEGIL